MVSPWRQIPNGSVNVAPDCAISFPSATTVVQEHDDIRLTGAVLPGGMLP
ncbi:hypothetical protein LAB1_34700 [Roseibium sp. LAB1]